MRLMLIVDCPAFDPRFAGFRRDELLSCLRRNSECGIFDEIVLLNEVDVPSDVLASMGRRNVTLVHTGKRLTYASAFEFAHERAKPTAATTSAAAADAAPAGDFRLRAVLANADIAFDHESCSLLRSAAIPENTVLACSRYNQEAGSVRSIIHHNQTSSQDAWVFDVPSPLLAKSKVGDIALGIIGCDNAVAGAMISAGMRLVNTSRYMVMFHVHASNVRKRKMRIKRSDDMPYGRSILLDKRAAAEMFGESAVRHPDYVDAPVAAPSQPADASAL